MENYPISHMYHTFTWYAAYANKCKQSTSNLINTGFESPGLLWVIQYNRFIFEFTLKAGNGNENNIQVLSANINKRHVSGYLFIVNNGARTVLR